jgi:hypothetical protein
LTCLTTESRISSSATSPVAKRLVEIGVLEEKTIGRDKLFIHPKLMRLLTRDDNNVAVYP